MKEIYFKEDIDILYNGIKKLHDAVASTMGPNGKTVIITDEHGKPYVTKDGVSVARKINFKDPVENIGAQLIKEVCELQVDMAGDGTTTAVVLANAFIQNLKQFDSNEINKAFDEIIPKIIKELKINSRELKNEDIKYVASISANNDIQIGNIIEQAYNHTSIIKVEESNNLIDSLELVDGMSLPVSYFSKHFITNPKKGECSLINPFVLLIDGKLDNLKPFELPIKEIAASNDSLLIITEHVSEALLRLIETNVLSGSLKACIIKSPGFSQHRKDLLNDIANFTGATVIKDFNKSYNLSILGKLKSVKINKNSSLLVKDESINVDELINTLTELSKSKEYSDYDKELITQRIENLKGKISIIKVGGGSEIEMKERKDRYDDAVLAVACALEEGVVEGGGISLYRIFHKFMDENTSLEYLDFQPPTEKDLFFREIYNCLSKPMYQIIDNGSILNIQENMFDKNIIDPLKVTRCAIENAVSIAKTILSTETIILNEYQWN